MHAKVSSLSGPVWSVNPLRSNVSRLSWSVHFTNVSIPSSDGNAGVVISMYNCSVPPLSAMQACSSLESWSREPGESLVPVGWVIPDSGVGAEGGAVGVGIAVGIGVSVAAGMDVAAAGTSVGASGGAGTSVGVGTSTSAVVGAGMGAAVGAWVTVDGDELAAGPEQAKRAVSAMKKAK